MHPHLEINFFLRRIRENLPFVFTRFSDGEVEILRGGRLVLDDQGIVTSNVVSNFRYPAYDHKSFDPVLDVDFRSALIESAIFRKENYFKGIPTSHNGAPESTNLLVELNGGSEENLTFADLWINSNYKIFMNKVVPELKKHDLLLLANYRTNPQLVSDSWTLFPVPDQVFQKHEKFKLEFMNMARGLPKGSIVLASASSMSNVLGLQVAKEGLEIFFIDVGTALHPLLGLEDSKRLYLSQLKPWRIHTLRQKLAYLIAKDRTLRW